MQKLGWRDLIFAQPVTPRDQVASPGRARHSVLVFISSVLDRSYDRMDLLARLRTVVVGTIVMRDSPRG